jgi:3'(2'), 5'-bisphosphate nucleotidase
VPALPACGPLDRELAFARDLAERAGAVVLRLRSPDLAVTLKPGDEPVTAADHAASDLIVTALAAAFPDDAIVCEETPDDPRRLQASRVWFVDPIDGTKDFIRGRDGFTVMIGLCVDGHPGLGVVHQPTRNRTYLAAPGAGPQIFEHGTSAPIRVSTVADLTQIRMVSSASHRTSAIDDVKSSLGIRHELSVGSVGLKLCLIASGDHDLYVNPSSHCKVWDTCAPEAILVAAGGRLTDLGGEALSYRDVDLRRTKGLVGSNGAVHAAVVAQLGDLFGSRPDR